MKTNHIIAIIAVVALTAGCKKKEEPVPFTATDVTGTTVVKGTVSKSVITPDGSGGWTSSSGASAAAPGVNVNITVKKSSLYPNSNAQGADVYSAKTDSAGNFSIPVKSNAGGVTANITIEGYSATLDTVVNGQTKKGLLTAFEGTNMQLTLVMGQTQQVNHRLTVQNIATNPNTLKTGTAMVTGSVSISLIEETMTGTLVSYSPVNIAPPAGHKVYLRLTNDPISGAEKTYETTTDANGVYSFQISTVESGSAGFPQNATIWINDYAATRDTLKTNNTRKTGPAGVFQMSSQFEGNLYNHTLRNAVYVRYNSFVPN